MGEVSIHNFLFTMMEKCSFYAFWKCKLNYAKGDYKIVSSTCKLVLEPEGGMSFVYIMLSFYHSIY